MPRLRLYDLRVSSFPTALGIPTGDVPEIAQAANEAEESLLTCKEVSEDGWYGTWAEIEFTASRWSPDVILPREVARLEHIDVCGRPVQNNNQFYEYLRYGNGRIGFGQKGQRRHCGPTQAYARNNAVLQRDLFPAPQLISVYITNPADAGKRILIQGLDNTNTPIYTQDVINPVQGQYVPFAVPFATAPQQFNRITGIQKDVTAGQVQVFQVDPTTGAQVLLLTMEPSETTAWYRRYRLDPLPWNCCHQPSNNPAENFVTVTAIAMLEHIPVVVDTDYLLIQSKRALTLEAQAIRMSRNDTPDAKAQAREYHLQAVRILIGECSRYMGKEDVAIQFKPFGSASLERAGVGTIR
jgi:hypothetical protein